LRRNNFRRIQLNWADGGYAGKLVQWISALRHGQQTQPTHWTLLIKRKEKNYPITLSAADLL
jgi:hypothetical protein